MTARLIISK